MIDVFFWQNGCVWTFRGHPNSIHWFSTKIAISTKHKLVGTPFVTNQFVCHHDGFIKMPAMCVFVLAKLEVSGQIHSRAHDQFSTLGLQFLAFEDSPSTERMAQENLSKPALEIPAFIDTKIYYNTGVLFPPRWTWGILWFIRRPWQGSIAVGFGHLHWHRVTGHALRASQLLYSLTYPLVN